MKKKSRTCSVEGCNLEHYSKGYCRKHYDNLRFYGTVKGSSIIRYGPICSVPDCGKSEYAKGYCLLHWRRFHKYGDPTSTYTPEITAHRTIAKHALGKPLPEGAEVHHLDGNETNNDPSNLIICPNHAYHMLLERRGRAYRTCGHADWLKCKFCKEYDDSKNLHIPISRKKGHALRETWAYHNKCYHKYYKL